jgi:FSR family fosmidomycin resistance protein-like MFS transporter
MNLITPILFAFSGSLGLTLAQQSMIAFVITTGGTLLQPIVGYLLDKVGKSSYLILGTLWISIGMSVTGLITNYYLLIAVAGLSAIASAIYHPLGSSIAANLSTVSRGKSLSVFMTIGGFAATFTPMVSIPIVDSYGLRPLVFFAIPGLITALFLKAANVDKIECKANTGIEKKQGPAIEKGKVVWLSLIVLISVIKVAVSSLLVVFGVQLMLAKGVNVITAGVILSTHMFLRSIGTLTGGLISDELGEKRVMIFFNIILLLVYAVTMFTSGFISAIGIVILGYVLQATATANITITHNILPENLNLGTGMIMGLSSTIAGIIVLIFGKYADVFGLVQMARISTVLVAVTVLISFFIPMKYVKLKKVESNVTECSLSE